MKIAFPLAVVVIVVLVTRATADEKAFVKEAEVAAATWLADIDAGKFDAGWEQSAPVIQMAVTKADWNKAMQVVRTPLGELKSRKLKSAKFTTSLPGVADGEYVVIQYETKFENKASAVETVTPQRNKEGLWQVSGYFIK